MSFDALEIRDWLILLQLTLLFSAMIEILNMPIDLLESATQCTQFSILSSDMTQMVNLLILLQLIHLVKALQKIVAESRVFYLSLITRESIVQNIQYIMLNFKARLFHTLERLDQFAIGSYIALNSTSNLHNRVLAYFVFKCMPFLT